MDNTIPLPFITALLIHIVLFLYVIDFIILFFRPVFLLQISEKNPNTRWTQLCRFILQTTRDVCKMNETSQQRKGAVHCTKFASYTYNQVLFDRYMKASGRVASDMHKLMQLHDGSITVDELRRMYECDNQHTLDNLPADNVELFCLEEVYWVHSVKPPYTPLIYIASFAVGSGDKLAVEVFVVPRHDHYDFLVLGNYVKQMTGHPYL